MSTATWNSTHHFDIAELKRSVRLAIGSLFKCLCLVACALCSLAVQIIAYPFLLATVLLLGTSLFGGFVLSVSLMIEAARHIPVLLGFS